MNRSPFAIPCRSRRPGPLLRTLLTCAGVALPTHTALAQARYVDVSLNGSYQENLDERKTNTRTSVGIELGLPVSDYLGITLGHMLHVNKDAFTDEYRDALRAKGYPIPTDATYETVDQITDTNLNGEVGYAIGPLKPMLFGGRLWRRVCQEDPFDDLGCRKLDPTWNAGVGLSVFVTHAIRLKMMYRLSPSALETSKKYDQLTTFGLTWSI